jgi:hypothetical protein
MPESTRRITEVEPVAIGNFFAVMYAVFGLIHAVPVLVGGPEKIGIPLGYYFPPFELKLTFNMAATTTTMRFLAAGATFIGFTVSGWLTGAVTALVFNAVAGLLGGISVSWQPERGKTEG